MRGEILYDNELEPNTGYRPASLAFVVNLSTDLENVEYPGPEHRRLEDLSRRLSHELVKALSDFGLQYPTDDSDSAGGASLEVFHFPETVYFLGFGDLERYVVEQAGSVDFGTILQVRGTYDLLRGMYKFVRPRLLEVGNPRFDFDVAMLPTQVEDCCKGWVERHRHPGLVPVSTLSYLSPEPKFGWHSFSYETKSAKYIVNVDVEGHEYRFTIFGSGNVELLEHFHDGHREAIEMVNIVKDNWQ